MMNGNHALSLLQPNGKPIINARRIEEMVEQARRQREIEIHLTAMMLIRDMRPHTIYGWKATTAFYVSMKPYTYRTREGLPLWLFIAHQSVTTAA